MRAAWNTAIIMRKGVYYHAIKTLTSPAPSSVPHGYAAHPIRDTASKAPTTSHTAYGAGTASVRSSRPTRSSAPLDR